MNSMVDWGSLVPGDMDKDKLIGHGVSKFVKSQNPENVSFKKYKNGYAIEVKTDAESVEKAKKFWENYVEPKL